MVAVAYDSYCCLIGPCDKPENQALFCTKLSKHLDRNLYSRLKWSHSDIFGDSVMSMTIDCAIYKPSIHTIYTCHGICDKLTVSIKLNYVSLALVLS